MTCCSFSSTREAAARLSLKRSKAFIPLGLPHNVLHSLHLLHIFIQAFPIDILYYINEGCQNDLINYMLPDYVI